MKRAQPQNHRLVPGTKSARQLMARHTGAQSGGIMAPLHDLVRRVGESPEQHAARLERDAHNAEIEYQRQMKLARKRVGPDVAAQLEDMVAKSVERVLDTAAKGGVRRPFISKLPESPR